jgi:hypothetical protein
VETLDELTQAVISFICYLSMRNISKSKIDLQVIGDLIEKDFIQLEQIF